MKEVLKSEGYVGWETKDFEFKVIICSLTRFQVCHSASSSAHRTREFLVEPLLPAFQASLVTAVRVNVIVLRSLIANWAHQSIIEIGSLIVRHFFLIVVIVFFLLGTFFYCL